MLGVLSLLAFSSNQDQKLKHKGPSVHFLLAVLNSLTDNHKNRGVAMIWPVSFPMK